MMTPTWTPSLYNLSYNASEEDREATLTTPDAHGRHKCEARYLLEDLETLQEGRETCAGRLTNTKASRRSPEASWKHNYDSNKCPVFERYGLCSKDTIERRLL